MLLRRGLPVFLVLLTLSAPLASPLSRLWHAIEALVSPAGNRGISKGRGGFDPNGLTLEGRGACGPDGLDGGGGCDPDGLTTTLDGRGACDPDGLFGGGGCDP